MTEQQPAKRFLDKEEAARHLIHTAIRMIMIAEDPFAIHLLVQSAEKILLDLSKKQGVALTLDWKPLIRKERQDEFFKRYREAYNYFKHADRDFDQELPVRDITMINVLGILCCVSGYQELFGYKTGHMQFISAFSFVVVPGVFKLPGDKADEFSEGMKEIKDLTPRRFFALAPKVKWIAGLGLENERTRDTEDHGDFYDTSFRELAKRDEKKNSSGKV
ncbi:MAG TPA: hypothetical protein ENH05_02595 [Rhizobiales bacterium]|nr:hypothetical protein BMS3Bbin10_00249 [bacterium BMS3Bbin10]HDO51605.1 hypothetical protein [Hyphomicrobiales bacterium]